MINRTCCYSYFLILVNILIVNILIVNILTIILVIPRQFIGARPLQGLGRTRVAACTRWTDGQAFRPEKMNDANWIGMAWDPSGAVGPDEDRLGDPAAALRRCNFLEMGLVAFVSWRTGSSS